jgi:hypothetical protein
MFKQKPEVLNTPPVSTLTKTEEKLMFHIYYHSKIVPFQFKPTGEKFLVSPFEADELDKLRKQKLN